MLNADAAMYKAKEAGKNQYKFYDAEIEFASDQMQKMHAELEAAVNENQFVLYFQPKFDCNTEAPVGAEALLRWNHPTKGMLKPIDFLPAAERFGLIDKINTWVIVETCQSIYRARKAGIMLNVSVNLSRQQFRNPELVEYIKKVMSQHNISPNSLIFEVSETNAIKNQNQFKSLLSKFKIAHLKVSIDDFGSHPFSLSYLQNLEISEVKLDKQFVAEITRHKSSRAMVEAVVKLAHALNLNVVAEGVETEEQRATISAAGCNQMQGFLFSDAVPEKQLLKMFRQISDNFEKTGSFSATEFNVENA
jgi:diguanylate cyclase